MSDENNHAAPAAGHTIQLEVEVVQLRDALAEAEDLLRRLSLDRNIRVHGSDSLVDELLEYVKRAAGRS